MFLCEKLLNATQMLMSDAMFHVAVVLDHRRKHAIKGACLTAILFLACVLLQYMRASFEKSLPHISLPIV